MCIRDRTKQGVGNRPGLLVDFLKHEPAETALFGGRGVPVDVVVLGCGRLAVEVGHENGGRGDGDDLILTEFDGVTGVVDEGRNIRSEEVFAFAATHYEGRITSGSDDDTGLPRIGDHKRERTVELATDGPHGFG